MQVKTLDKFTIIYLVIPIFIFLIGWLNPILAAISCIVLIYVVKQIFNCLLKRKFEINKYQLLLLTLIALLWCIFAGIGCFFYQNWDWHVRNAIFRDLINFSYPVIYDNGAALVYYFGSFLPGAIVGKLALFLHATPDQAFKIGNMFTLIYSTIGITLVFLQVLLLTNVKKNHYFLIILLFILFSGLDVLYKSIGPMNNIHIENHSPGYQLSSFTTLLFWAYNRTIAPWLITAFFLRKPFNISNYGFLGCFGLFYAPLPFIGLFIYFSLVTTLMFFRTLNTKYFFSFYRKLFNTNNTLAIFILLPIFYFYYNSNLAVIENNYLFASHPMQIFGNVLIEVGIYMFLIFKRNIKNPIYYITIFVLFFCPLISLGRNPDFCMRTTIPATFALFVLVMRYLFHKNSFILGKFILCCAILLGMVTPCLEFYRGYLYNYINFVEPKIKDEVISFNNKIRKDCVVEIITPSCVYGDYKNYGAVDLDNQIFFKYLAKKNKNKGIY